MNQVIQNYRPGAIALKDVPAPAMTPGTVLVRNAASIVSVGTEKLMTDLARKSLLGKARARPDLVKRVIDKARLEGVGEAFRQAANRLDTPVPLGYSCAGRVLSAAEDADGFSVGDNVACGGHAVASHAEIVRAPHNLCAPVPEGVALEEAAFAFIGAIALHTVRTAEVELGERVAIIGLGLLGQIAAQIVRAAGAEVFGLDLDAAKVDLALELGANGAAQAEPEAAQRAMQFTEGRGFDAVLILASTTSNQPTELAVELARDRGRIAAAGMVRMDMPRNAMYEKELRVVVPRSAGPGGDDPAYEQMGVDYPVAYVPWTEQRNMEAFLKLVAAGAVRVGRLVSHQFPVERALDAYQLLSGERREPYLGVVLTYDAKEAADRRQRLEVRQHRLAARDTVRLAVIGGGLFATSVLLPAMRKLDEVHLRGVATTSGVSAEHVARKFGFDYGTTDVDEVLKDRDTDAVMILTRHGSHAELVCQALGCDKDVFVEKPLAITPEQLRAIEEAYTSGRTRLMVGFNRRFAPLVAEAKSAIGGTPGDLVVVCRVNAGSIEPDHWIQDPKEGAGRVIGEVCHFVDLVQHLAGANIVTVFARQTSDEPDNLCATLTMANGAVATIVYTASGNKAFPRERVEVFAGQTVGVIDDFRRGSFIRDGKRWSRRGFSVDRGHRAELEALVECLKAGREFPVAFGEYVNTTLATFGIERSLRENRPVTLNSDRHGPASDHAGNAR
ncbi:MAG: bi-domain-containing oxidoreductase [Armatimonadota bacterium]